MRIVYYSPEATRSAPAMVARELLSGLSQKAGELPGKLTVTGPDSICDHVENLGLEFRRIAEIPNLVRKGDLIHIPLTPWIAPNARFLFQVRSWFSKGMLIVNCHGDFLTETWFKLVNGEYRSAVLALPSAILAPFLLRANDRLVVNSARMKELLSTRGTVQSSKVVVIPNGIGIDPKAAGIISPENRLERPIVFHGRISREKGILELIEAFAKVLRSGLAESLVCVGDGPSKPFIERRVQQLGCSSSIKFTGWLPREEILPILARASVCVYPSLYEPFSISVLEALAVSSGPICVSSRVGALEFVKDLPRILVMEPNVEDIVRVLKEALSMSATGPLDPEGSQVPLESLTWENVVSQYIDLYEHLSVSNKT